MVPGHPAVPDVVLEPHADCGLRLLFVAALAVWVVWRLYPAVRAARPERLRMLAVALSIWWRSRRSFICCSSRSGDSTTGVLPLDAQLDFSKRPRHGRCGRGFGARGAFERSTGSIALPTRIRLRPRACRPMRVRLAPAFAQAQRDLGTATSATPARPKARSDLAVLPLGDRGRHGESVRSRGAGQSRHPAVERPYVVAHEWGHIAGWARESEAGYVGWLTCMRGDDAARYSAWISLYLHLRGEVVSDRARSGSMPAWRRDHCETSPPSASASSAAGPPFSAPAGALTTRSSRANRVEGRHPQLRRDRVARDRHRD